jgi:hypothetical protein
MRSGWRDTPGWPQLLSPSELLSGPLYSPLLLSQIALDNWSAPATSVSLVGCCCYYEWELLTVQENSVCRIVHINVFEKWNVIVLWAVWCWSLFWKSRFSVFIAAYHRHFSTGDQQLNISALSRPHITMPETRCKARYRKLCSFVRLPNELWRPHNLDFSGVKRPERRADHKLDRAELRKSGAIPPPHFDNDKFTIRNISDDLSHCQH